MDWSLNTLYCGKCRELLPVKELKLDRKTDMMLCERCRK